MRDQKELRKQLRNVVRDLLPETLTKEMQDSITRTIQDFMTKRLNLISNDITAQLTKMSERSKDVQDFIMRQALATTQSPVAKPEAQEAVNGKVVEEVGEAERS
jgi:hypothetical protein